jgi:DNA invertase Pin-like site-specific DNA recombinase
LLVDEDVSAFSTPLSKREYGKQLWDALRRGDTVVMTKIDRGFRSWADAAVTYGTWRELGVTLKFLDMDIDLSTPQGELFFSQMVAFAQYESRMHGQRKREVYAWKRMMGKPYSCIRPWGWRSTKNKDGKLDGWESIPSEQEVGKRVLAMRERGLSWYEIASELSVRGCRKPLRQRGGSGYYHVADVRSLARAAEAGYPRLPQAFWHTADYEQRLHAARANGQPL